MLAAAPTVQYIHEPFHPGHRHGVFPVETSHWLTYVPGSGREAEYEAAVRSLLSYRYAFAQELKLVAKWRDPRASVRDARMFRIARLEGRRALVKDPLAVFSTEWLADRFNFLPVICLRHPASFAGSIVHRQWHYPFADLLAQPALMNELLNPWRDEVERAARGALPLAEQAALLWVMVYGSVAAMISRHPDWVVVRHEDLSADPISEFRAVYDQLALDFTATAQAVIHDSISKTKPDVKPVARSLHRHPEEVTQGWRTILSRSDVDHIRQVVEPVSAAYYDDSTW